jgi:hypothetical protein
VLKILLAVLLVAHGVGHTVGFWISVPLWFAFLWVLPGASFASAAWGVWTQADWWPVVTIAAALVSGALLLLLQPTALRAPGPLVSALAFDLVALAALLLPWSHRFLNGP